MAPETDMNGAGCMLYTGVLKDFSDSQGNGVDLIILASITHEVLLLMDDGQADYDSLRQMVKHINQTEVSKEDYLSDGIYRYIREIDRIELIPVVSDKVV